MKVKFNLKHDFRLYKTVKMKLFWLLAALLLIMLLVLIIGFTVRIFALALHNDASDFVDQLTQQAHKDGTVPWDCSITNVGTCILYSNAKKQLDQTIGLLNASTFLLLIGGISSGFCVISGLFTFFWKEKPEQIIVTQNYPLQNQQFSK